MESDFDDELDPDLAGPDGDDDPEPDDWDDQPALTSELTDDDPASDPDDSLDHGGYAGDPDDESYADDDALADDEPYPEYGPVTEAVGADPDLPDADWDPDPFPLPDLDLDDLPEPAGGPPWIDASLLGASGPFDDAEPAASPDGGREDLAAADADPDASWDTLRTAEDPAVRALARLWAPTDPEP